MYKQKEGIWPSLSTPSRLAKASPNQKKAKLPKCYKIKPKCLDATRKLKNFSSYPLNELLKESKLNCGDLGRKWLPTISVKKIIMENR